ncbi:MAG: DNA polymerase IV [Oscillospiraceae bacterium]|nr:DNA polymerase IV [Oscillospiraceae bacterium]
MSRVILHSDLNNFFASIECLYKPELKSKAVAVIGDPEARHGIVLAKNELAKKYKVQTGDPVWLARQKCPDFTFVEPHFDLYMKYSGYAKAIYSDYTDKIESFGLDECWLDVTENVWRYGSGKEIADRIRRRMKSELGVSVSVGVSFNKVFAKLGSDLKKPDATTVIENEKFKEIVWPLKVNELLYVGRQTHKKLNRRGIFTIGDLAKANPDNLRFMLGKNGVMLWEFANGLDTSPVTNIGAMSLIKTVGNSTTCPRDLVCDEYVKIVLRILCEKVSQRLRSYGFICKTVQLGVRGTDLHWFERQGVLDIPNRTAKSLFDMAFSLYKKNSDGSPIRSLSVRASKLEPSDYIQLSLLPEMAMLEKEEELDATIDSIRERFGRNSITRGLIMTDRQLSDFEPGAICSLPYSNN